MTIDYKPSDYTSVNETIIVTAIDAHWTADPNYKYVAALFYHNGTTWVQITSQQTRPDPTTGYGIFNFSKQCQGVFNPKVKLDTYITNLFDFGINEIYGRFKVEVREEYLGTISAVLDTEEFYLVNTFNKSYNVAAFDSFAALYAGVKYGYLSNRQGSEFKISKRAKYFFCPILNFTATNPRTFDFVYNGTTFTPSLANMKAHHINIAVDNLIAEGCTIDYNVAKDLVIQIGGGGANVTTLSYNIVCDERSDHYTLHFLNAWGVFESFLFSKPARKNIKKEVKSYEKKSYQVSGSGQFSMYEPTSSLVRIATKVNYNTQYKETVTLKSDFISDTDYKWLKELVNSSMVYCSINDSTILLPVSILNTTYEEKTYETSKLTQLSLDIEFNQDFYSQIN